MDLITASLHHLYTAAQSRHPDVLFYGAASNRTIALTFDDGPHLRDTPRLLDVLEKYNVRATFHLVGKHAEQHRSLIKHIHDSGHQLALHCYRHLPFPMEKMETLHRQLQHTRNVIADSCGIAPQTIRDLRPPYGVYSERTLSHLKDWGYRLVMWSCMPPHWMQPMDWSVQQIMAAVMPGAVIVLHDGHGHGSRVAEIVAQIVPRIQLLGYEFVRVEEMQEQREQLPALR